jgi:hypothetical protein
MRVLAAPLRRGRFMKLFSLLMVALLCVGLASCAVPTPEATPESTATPDIEATIAAGIESALATREAQRTPTPTCADTDAYCYCNAYAYLHSNARADTYPDLYPCSGAYPGYLCRRCTGETLGGAYKHAGSPGDGRHL